MSEAILKTTAGGAILCDASLAAQVDERWFDPQHWGGPHGAVITAGGRGAAWMVSTSAGACVLRHYRRGGAMARLFRDWYFWHGAEQTRPFREFRLLQHLQRLGLPAPQAVAARYRRRGLFYQADLLMRRIAEAQTLAEILHAGRLDAALMRRVGDLIARFHRAGIWHADLNVHNVLRARDEVFLIDFDRGQIRAPAATWQQQNLERLRRSLVKVGAADAGEAAFEAGLWQPLRQAHAAALSQVHNASPGKPVDRQQ